MADAYSKSADDKVKENLFQICYEIHNADLETYPKSLSDVTNYADLKADLFVVPGTGNQPGEMSEIENWTDYIFVGNVFDIDVAVIISPPENHNNKYGYVAFWGCRISKLPPEQVRQLIKDPVSMATNTSKRMIEIERKRIVVYVPKRLQRFYPPDAVYHACN